MVYAKGYYPPIHSPKNTHTKSHAGSLKVTGPSVLWRTIPISKGGPQKYTNKARTNRETANNKKKTRSDRGQTWLGWAFLAPRLLPPPSSVSPSRPETDQSPKKKVVLGSDITSLFRFSGMPPKVGFTSNTWSICGVRGGDYGLLRWDTFFGGRWRVENGIFGNRSSDTGTGKGRLVGWWAGKGHL